MDFYFVNVKSILTLDEGMATPHRWYREKKMVAKQQHEIKSNDWTFALNETVGKWRKQ